MESAQRLLEVKLDSAIDRCETLRAFVEGLSAKSYASLGTRKLFQAVTKAVADLAAYLRTARTDADLLLLTERELETSLQRRISLLPLLHEVLEVVERSDVGSVRPELLSSLRRRVNLSFQDADVILVSKIDLNYSIVEVRAPLERILVTFGMALPTDFPGRLFLATIPAVEHDQALLHCILGHEIGHSIFEEDGLEDKILPIAIDESSFPGVKPAVAPSDSADSGATTLPDDSPTRREIREKVTNTVTNWIRELSSDVFGVLSFGPAFLFAFLRFTTSHQRLDSAGETHPPGRLRLKLIFRALDKWFPPEVFSAVTGSFLEDWRRIANTPASPAVAEVDRLALTSINNDVLDRIQGAVESVVSPPVAYSPDRYRRAATKLVELINAHIPPVEFLTESGVVEINGPVDILNAGWEVFLGGCTSFREGQKATSDVDVQLKLNELLMKALELYDARLTWQEAAGHVS